MAGHFFAAAGLKGTGGLCVVLCVLLCLLGQAIPLGTYLEVKRMAMFEVRFDIAEAYIVQVEAESAEAAVALVEADPHGFADENASRGWDLVYPSVATEVN